MGPVSGFVVFIILWWTALFTVLPFSLVRDETGKPDDPRMKQKFMITTLFSVVLWGAVYLLVWAELIDFRHLAEVMAQKDLQRDAS